MLTALGYGIDALEEVSRQVRAKVIENSWRTSTPHLGSCLSSIDILVAAYFCKLKLDTEDPRNFSRDRFILSKGHAAPALFQVLAMRGFFPQSLMDNYGQDGSLFAEHPPTPEYLPGIEAATGSLGHGLSIGLGMAIARRIRNDKFMVSVLLGDGECNEGSVWEAAMLTPAQEIGNFCVLIDFNKWQATGKSIDIMSLAPLSAKWKAFGWTTLDINGHAMEEITSALDVAAKSSDKPVAIIAHTIKGKGVNFMENDNNWHYRIPNEQEVLESKKQLGVI